MWHWQPCASELGTMVVCALFALTGIARAADVPGQAAGPAPTTKPAAPLLGEVNFQTLAPRTFMFVPRQTTFDKLPATIEEAMAPLSKAIKERHIEVAEVAGTMIFVYHGIGQDMTEPFTLQVGITVADGTPSPGGDVQVRKLDTFRCATLLYTGPVGFIGQAFEKLMPAIFQRQQTPTDEVREYYLYWEGKESPNNVVMLAVGLK